VQQENPSQRLSHISTLWSLVCRAHRGSPEETKSSRQQLLERYGAAVERYLRKMLGDRDAANEVFQNFALNLLRGDLGGADPKRGRFRNFVKGTLFHLIADYRKQRRDFPGTLPVGDAEPEADLEEYEPDRQFEESWCDELLARAWAALAKIEAKTGQPLYAVLRFRADHSQMRSPQMAEELAALLGRPFTAAGARQTLHRAREKFADLLLEEVTHSLDNPTDEQLEQELMDLGLLHYCRSALDRHRPKE
jgi:RNA polymerase sigma-70 factor (ECF subfamily)